MSHICVYKTPPLKTEIANVWIWKTYQYEGWKAVVDNAVRHVQLFSSTRAASLHPLSCWHFYFIPACLDSSFIYRCVMVTRQGNKSSRGWNCAVQDVFLSLADRIPTSRKLDQLDQLSWMAGMRKYMLHNTIYLTSLIGYASCSMARKGVLLYM